MRLPFLIILVLFSFLTSCQPEDDLPEPQINLEYKKFTSFTFLKANNPELPQDITGTIVGNDIRVHLPAGINSNNLIASFTTLNNTKVYVGKTEQVSGVTANNYSAQVFYKVVSTNGARASYTVESDQAFPELDRTVPSLMTKYNIPGLSVAIVKNEKLVFVKNYGYADKEKKYYVNSESLFRIGSISKPITAIAILKLVQENKLNLQEKVFGINSILRNEYGTPAASSDVNQITVQNLLEHKSGWTNNPDDPMILNFNSTQKQIITNAVLKRPLKYIPGTTYSYSNLGYCILGRIIEKVTGKTYADYITSEILNPIGITNMKIAGNTLNQQVPNEVKYYQSEWNPYSINVTRMDAHGGWLASTTDLMRFMVHIDRNTLKQDILSSSVLNDTYFNSTNWFHSGSLPGTSGFITRLNDEYSFVVLANSRINADAQVFFEKFYTIIKEEIFAKSTWPEIDLFDSGI